MNRGRAHLVDLRLSTKSTIVASEMDFLQSYRLHPRDVARGDLRNLAEGGQMQDIIIHVPDYFLQFQGQTIYFALMTLDESHNRSPISNLAFVAVDQLKPVDVHVDVFARRPPYGTDQTHARIVQPYGPHKNLYDHGSIASETHMKYPIDDMVEPLTVLSQRMVLNTPSR